MSKRIDYKAPLRGIALLILTMLSRFAEAFTNRIKDAEVRLMAIGLLGSSQKVIKALSDADPNDKDQLRAIFHKLLTSGEFKDGANAEILSRINQLKNSDVKTMLSILNNQTFKVVGLLTDDDTENTQQLTDEMRSLIRTEDGLLLLRSLLGLLLDNEQFADTAAVLIIDLLMTVLKEEGNEKISARLAVMHDTYTRRSLAA